MAEHIETCGGCDECCWEAWAQCDYCGADLTEDEAVIRKRIINGQTVTFILCDECCHEQWEDL